MRTYTGEISIADDDACIFYKKLSETKKKQPQKQYNTISTPRRIRII